MEKIENLKKTIKNNLIKYRKAAGLTQVQLAQKLGYSDKSVSKWEREEGVPDIYILKEIADLYGITVNDLISEQPTIKEKAKDKIKTILSQRNKIIISLLAAAAIWAIATTLYVILHVFTNIDTKQLENIYVYSIPVTCIVFLVFNSIWGKKYLNFIFISGFIWTLVLSLYVTFTAIDKISELFIIAIPLQILVVLCFLFGKNKKVSTNK